MQNITPLSTMVTAKYLYHLPLADYVLVCLSYPGIPRRTTPSINLTFLPFDGHSSGRPAGPPPPPLLPPPPSSPPSSIHLYIPLVCGNTSEFRSPKRTISPSRHIQSRGKPLSLWRANHVARTRAGDHLPCCRSPYNKLFSPPL